MKGSVQRWGKWTRANVQKHGEFAETQKENGFSIYLRERPRKRTVLYLEKKVLNDVVGYSLTKQPPEEKEEKEVEEKKKEKKKKEKKNKETTKRNCDC